MPVEVKRTSDFPLGDVKGNIEKDDVIEVTAVRKTQTGFFKTKPMLMSAGRWGRLLKDTGAKPDWQVYETETTATGVEIIDAKTGKPKKHFVDIADPKKYSVSKGLA